MNEPISSPLTPGRGLAIHAVAAFLALPGVVGYLVPVLLGLNDRGPEPWLGGLLLVGASSVLLGCCAVEFYRAGKGTLAPWAPPRDLVVSGPYKWSRNPMYVAVLALTLGWALWFRSPQVGFYTSALAVGFHLRITLYEEPRLAAAFASQWAGYKMRVRRWL